MTELIGHGCDVSVYADNGTVYVQAYGMLTARQRKAVAAANGRLPSEEAAARALLMDFPGAEVRS